ncbi:MAG: hypothetical protein AAF787_17180 [Chloroflexota bacterium]
MELSSTPVTFFDVITVMFSRDQETIMALFDAPNILPIALQILFFALLSETVGQSIILFANRVRWRRFSLSLLMNTTLYLLSVLAYGFTLWVVVELRYDLQQPFRQIVIMIGLAHTPLLFGFLGFMPYLGMPIVRFLQIYMVILVWLGLRAVFEIPLVNALAAIVFTVIFVEALRRTIGRPVVARISQMKATVAGTPIVENYRTLLPRLPKE